MTQLLNSPLLITRAQAASLLGISINTFDRRVRRSLYAIKIGTSVRFRRIEIEEWINDTPECYERPALSKQGDRKWDIEKSPKDSLNVTAFGTSKNKSTGSEFDKALARVTNEKLRNS